MDAKTKYLLKEIGLTEGEIKVYLSLIKIGKTTTGPIIKDSGISGSKVYEILDKLIKKGLVSYIIKEKTKYFFAESPKNLEDYLEKKIGKLEKLKNSIKEVEEKLKKIRKEEETYAKIFEGLEGIKTVFIMILENIKPGEEYYAFTLGDELKDKKVINFLLNYHRKRIRKKIKVKILAKRGEEKLFNELKGLRYLELKFSETELPTGTFIFNDFIALIQFKERIAFLIKNRKLAEAYKKFFMSIWHGVKKK